MAEIENRVPPRGWFKFSSTVKSNELPRSVEIVMVSRHPETVVKIEFWAWNWENPIGMFAVMVLIIC